MSMDLTDHIFHTDNDEIWQFVQRFASFNHFSYRPKVSYKGTIYSFPINMMTFHQLWGVKTPEEAKRKLSEVKVPIAKPSNLRDYILSELGEEIYHTFFEGYTKKQWGRDPSLLPASIVKRLPIRLTYDDNYYTDRYQGIPIGGYTKMVGNMLEGIEVALGVDYLEHKDKLNKIADKIVYTGPVDALYDYCCGKLEYRSLEFRHHHAKNIKDFQGVAGKNYTDEETPCTRTIEHKHFEFKNTDTTIITEEFPKPYEETNEPFYPVANPENNAIWGRYRELAQWNGVILGGRLGQYQYLDMHQAIGSAIRTVERELKR